MKTALVLGGAGFVGRRLTKYLLAMGVETRVIDDLSSGLHPHLWLGAPEPAGFSFYKVDARYYCRNFFTKFDVVFHCAAVVGGRLTIDGDPLRVATDLSIDSEFFQWCVKSRPGKVVYFSSSAAYPIHYQRQGQHCPLSEGFIDLTSSRLGMPDQSYGWSKLTGELLAQHAVKTYDLDVVCYRPFSGYGEDQSSDYPFPAIMRRVLDNENPLVVWGSGEQMRDFIHIDDCVEAIFATMDLLKPGGVLNIGSGVGTTFKQLALMAGNLVGRAVTVANDPTKPEGVFARVASTARLNQWFTPRITLEEGMGRVLKALDRERKAS